ncbi:MAG: hypothetical protein RLZZ387_975 [Chloroflexota bacterium]
MSTPNRTLPILAYVLPLAGPALTLATRRDDTFARYHGTQGLAIDIGALAAPVVWAALGWVLAWIPTIGPLAALVTFALVVAFELLMLGARALGVARVLRGQLGAAPVVGGWAERIALGGEPAAASPMSPVAPEVIEATAEQPPEAAGPKAVG